MKKTFDADSMKWQNSLAWIFVLAFLTTSCDKGPADTADQPSPFPPTRGLVAYYPLDGDAADHSGNGLNGTVNGATITMDRFQRNGRALSFDGLSDFISIPHDSLFNMGNNFAVSLWFKLTDVSTTRTLISKNGTQAEINDYLSLSITQASGLLAARIANGSAELTVYSNKPLNDDLWHHTVVMVGASLQLWVDGQFSNQVDQPFEAKPNSDTLFIGSWTRSALFKGEIDDVRIYDRGLKYSEITALYDEE